MSAVNHAVAAVSWAESPGVETLRRMASVDQYNRWVFKALAEHVGESILEVGCGIGNMTPFLLAAQHLTCIDVSRESVESVRQSFARYPQVNAQVGDIADSEVVRQLGTARYDTVVCINVLEHIEHDDRALSGMHDVLVPGGKLLLFVPAGPYLYGHLDVALGHYRRYSLQPLVELVRDQGFDTVDAFYMNVPGIPGWFLSSRILRREAPPRGLLWLFNLLAPAFIRIEEKLKLPFGQSIVCIARRPE